MSEREYILKNHQWKYLSQDYARLRQEGLQHIEKLAGDLWTDYNSHDPGISILELLCYAITDLGYRTDYRMKDILSVEHQGRTTLRKQFHPAKDIFSCAPVTFKDLRKLLIAVKGVRNAWVKQHKGVDQDDTVLVNGMYEVSVEYEEWISKAQQTSGLIPYDTIEELLHTNRNLCEDCIRITTVEFEDIAICADVEVSPEANLEEMLAEIFYQLDNFISPEARFFSIEEMLKKGLSIDEIFSGPFLQPGFIDDDELERIEPACTLTVTDLSRIILDVSGVLTVKEVFLASCKNQDKGEGNTVSEQHFHGEKWSLTLAEDKSPRLSTHLSCITFYKNNRPYFANKSIVENLFKAKKDRSRNTRVPESETTLPEPIGTDRNLGEYYPFQNELPATYRTGMNKVPESEGDGRQAQSRQLKAYLMFFEQVLANYLSQLDHVHELFSWDSDSEPEQSYFTQIITGISNVEELYVHVDSEKKTKTTFEERLTEKLREIIESSGDAAQRKNRFLDHLMARFCESFSEYSVLMFKLEEEETARKRIIKDQQCFLKNYPELSSQRGMGSEPKGILRTTEAVTRTVSIISLA